MGRQRDRSSGDPKADKGYYQGTGSGPDEMRMQAIRDEQLRKKEQGLPGFQSNDYERTPLTNGAEEEDKYYVEEPQHQPQPQVGGLQPDGSLVQGVGMGYGRRGNRAPGPGPQGYGGQQDGYGNYTDLAPIRPVPARTPSTGSGLTSAGNAGLGAGGGGVESNRQPGYGGYNGNGQNNCELRQSI